MECEQKVCEHVSINTSDVQDRPRAVLAPAARVPFLSYHRAATPQTTKPVKPAPLKMHEHLVRYGNIPALCATMYTVCNEWFAAPCRCGADGRRHSAIPVLHPAESSLSRAHINCRFYNTPFSVVWLLHCAWYLHKDALL